MANQGHEHGIPKSGNQSEATTDYAVHGVRRAPRGLLNPTRPNLRGNIVPHIYRICARTGTETETEEEAFYSRSCNCTCLSSCGATKTAPTANTPFFSD